MELGNINMNKYLTYNKETGVVVSEKSLFDDEVEVNERVLESRNRGLVRYNRKPHESLNELTVDSDGNVNFEERPVFYEDKEETE